MMKLARSISTNQAKDTPSTPSMLPAKRNPSITSIGQVELSTLVTSLQSQRQLLSLALGTDQDLLHTRPQRMVEIPGDIRTLQFPPVCHIRRPEHQAAGAEVPPRARLHGPRLRHHTPVDLPDHPGEIAPVPEDTLTHRGVDLELSRCGNAQEVLAGQAQGDLRSEVEIQYDFGEEFDWEGC